MNSAEDFREVSEHDLSSGFHETNAEDLERQAVEAGATGRTDEAEGLSEEARLARGRFRRTKTVELFHKLRGTDDPDKA